MTDALRTITVVVYERTRWGNLAVSPTGEHYMHTPPPSPHAHAHTHLGGSGDAGGTVMLRKHKKIKITEAQALRTPFS